MDEETREKTLQKSRQDRFAELLGIELVDIKPGYGLVSMAVGDSMLNFHGLLHGGAIFSLADVALGAAASSRGRMSVGLSVDITYLSPSYLAPGSSRRPARSISERGRLSTTSPSPPTVVIW